MLTVAAIKQAGSLEHVTVRRPDRLLAMDGVRALIFVGGMGAGKSTVAQAIAADPRIAGRYAIARRVTTRRPRRGDDAEPITFVSWTRFDELRVSGALALSWAAPIGRRSDRLRMRAGE
jgi:guanylate kinase